MDPDGKTSDFWNMGVNMLFANIISHHVMIVMETRNFTWVVALWYSVSFGTLFLNIWLNDSFVDQYYKT